MMIFYGSEDKYWGHRNKNIKKPLAFGEKPNPVGT